MTTRREFLQSSAGALLGTGVLPMARAAAQDYPAKPIKIIVPLAPGGITDFLARVAADYLYKATGQQVVVENRSGGGGVLGLEAVAKSPADGYTLGVVTAGDLVVTPYLYQHLSFDPLKELTPVAYLGDAPQLLAINAELPAKTLQEFIAYAKTKPGQINYGTAGAGSLTHIGAFLFGRLAGLDLVPVSYRGVVPAVSDLITGRIQMMHTSLAGIVAHVRAGTVRILCVTVPERWTDRLPDVPTSAEAGLPDYLMDIWFALVAPRGTPAPIVDGLNAHMRAMATDAVSRKRLVDGFVRPESMSLSDFQGFVAREAPKWERLVHDTGVTLD